MLPSRTTRRVRATTVPDVAVPTESTAREWARERRARRRGRGRRILRWVGALLLLALVFLAGLAIGRAIESTPAEGDQTLVRTLVVPGTLTPSETVTVTVSNP
jgi:hypothetical protein